MIYITCPCLGAYHVDFISTFFVIYIDRINVFNPASGCIEMALIFTPNGTCIAASMPINSDFTVPLKGIRAWVTIQWTPPHPRSIVFLGGGGQTYFSISTSKWKIKEIKTKNDGGRGQLPPTLKYLIHWSTYKISIYIFTLFEKEWRGQFVKTLFFYIWWSAKNVSFLNSVLIKKRVSKIIVKFGFIKHLQCLHCLISIIRRIC